jgi:hypothetical protein
MNKGNLDSDGANTSKLHFSPRLSWNLAKYSASRGHALLASVPPYPKVVDAIKQNIK